MILNQSACIFALGYFLILNSNQHDKMQLFAKFKKSLRRGFRATFEPLSQNFFKLCKKLHLIMLTTILIIKNGGH